MKKCIVSIALFALSSAFLAKADDITTAADSVVIDLRVDTPIKDPIFRMPSTNSIRCVYFDSRLYFSGYPGALLRVTLTHENSGFRGEYVISSELPFVTITTEVGLYRIEAITEDQRYYYGEITL